MATVAGQPTKPRKTTGNRARDPFGGGIPLALLAIAVTLIGFWRTFFTQLPNTDTLHMLHGASSTGWLVLVLVQASLIRSGLYRWHRVLGWGSALLFALLIWSSWQVLVLMLSGGSAVPLPLDFAKLFAYSDVTALPLMVLLYGGAIVWRKDRHLHSRLISATLLAGLLPASARMFNRVWPGMDGLIFAMHPTYLFELAVLAVAIFIDWKNNRLRWPFPFAFVWLAVSYATLFPGSNSVWFDALARWIGSTA
jgi:hypothetical protein